jgi:hypothetical protein
MVGPPATSEAGAHAAGDTKSEHFEPTRVIKLNEKQFSTTLHVIHEASMSCSQNK